MKGVIPFDIVGRLIRDGEEVRREYRRKLVNADVAWQIVTCPNGWRVCGVKKVVEQGPGGEEVRRE